MDPRNFHKLTHPPEEKIRGHRKKPFRNPPGPNPKQQHILYRRNSQN